MITGLVDRDCSWRTETLIPALRMYGVDSRPFFLPLSSLPAYAHHEQHTTGSNQNPNAYELAPRGINLPSGLQLTEDDVDYVCTTLDSLLDADPVSVVTH